MKCTDNCHFYRQKCRDQCLVNDYFCITKCEETLASCIRDCPCQENCPEGCSKCDTFYCKCQSDEPTDEQLECENDIGQEFLDCYAKCKVDDECKRKCALEYDTQLKTCPCREGCLNGCPCPEYDCKLAFKCQDYKEQSDCYAKVYEAVAQELVKSIDILIRVQICKNQCNGFLELCDKLNFISMADWDALIKNLYESFIFLLDYCPCEKRCPNGCPCAEYDCSNAEFSNHIEDFSKLIEEKSYL